MRQRCIQRGLNNVGTTTSGSVSAGECELITGDWGSLPVSMTFAPVGPHPKPQSEQQESRSSAEMCAFSFPPDAIQTRSDIASTAPNACEGQRGR